MNTELSMRYAPCCREPRTPGLRLTAASSAADCSVAVKASW